MFGAVGLLLLIAVANIAGLTLAQLHQREREMAIRSSVGASRGQVIATVMREVLLIALAGAALGAGAAAIGVNVMGEAFASLPRMAELSFDWRALVFAAGSSLIAARCSARFRRFKRRARIWRRCWRDPAAAFPVDAGVLQRGLVVAQLAFTVLLLASAGLLLRSYYNLTRVDAGFSTAHTLTFHVGAAWDEDRPRIGRMQKQFWRHWSAVPGVEAAGITNFLPATGATLNYQVKVDGTGENRRERPYSLRASAR